MLTPEQVAERLSIARSGLYNLLSQGKLAHFRIGRVIRIRESDLTTFLDTQRVDGFSPAYVSYPKS